MSASFADHWVLMNDSTRMFHFMQRWQIHFTYTMQLRIFISLRRSHILYDRTKSWETKVRILGRVLELFLLGTSTDIKMMHFSYISSLNTTRCLVNLNTSYGCSDGPRLLLVVRVTFTLNFLLFDHIRSRLGIFILYSILFLLLILTHFHI